MMRKKILIYLLGCLASCSSAVDSENKIVVKNDFDMLDGWGTCANNSITKERAHSGKYSIKVDQNVEFSVGFQKPLLELMPDKPKKLKLTSWVYSPSPDGKAVIEFDVIDLDNRKISDASYKLEEKLRSYKQWVKIKKVITIPDNVQPNHQLRLFLWRANATVPVFMDDITIEWVE